MKIFKIIDFTLLILFIPVLSSVIMGGCQIQDYFEQTNNFHEEPVELSYLKIDSFSSFNTESSNKYFYYGHGYIIKDSLVRKKVTLNNIDYYTKHQEKYWKLYLKENDNLIPIWYNKRFQKINIPPMRNKEEVISRVKKSGRKYIAIFFSPLIFFVLLLLLRNYLSRKILGCILFLVLASVSLSAQPLIYEYDVIIEEKFSDQVTLNGPNSALSNRR